jgi:predicted acetyltransferase
MQLAEPPRLLPPGTDVRESWLAAERAACASGGSAEVLDEALADFQGFVARRQGTPLSWDVPCTFLWWVSGDQYVGELVIRHELTPALLKSGGHVGYEVAIPWRRQGHGTAMLAAGLVECARLGLRRVLLTIDANNVASRRVALANGGVLEGRAYGEDRFWITIGSGQSAPRPCTAPLPPAD